MKALRLAGPIILYFAVANAFAEPPGEKPEARTIPLKEIWAYDMPGTHDVSKSEDDKVAKKLTQILAALSKASPKSQEAEEGFAVSGTKLDALRELYSIVVDGKKHSRVFPVDRELTLVFFSHACGQYVRLQQIVRRGREIEIHYRFEPHKSKEITQHFALIPLSGITPGEVRVNIVRDPMPDEFVKAGWKPVSPEVANRIVSKSFTFRVE